MATVRSNVAETFFPVSIAHVKEDDIIVDMPEDEIKNAPRIEVDEQIGVSEDGNVQHKEVVIEKQPVSDDNIADKSNR